MKSHVYSKQCKFTLACYSAKFQKIPRLSIFAVLSKTRVLEPDLDWKVNNSDVAPTRRLTIFRGIIILISDIAEYIVVHVDSLWTNYWTPCPIPLLPYIINALCKSRNDLLCVNLRDYLWIGTFAIFHLYYNIATKFWKVKINDFFLGLLFILAHWFLQNWIRTRLWTIYSKILIIVIVGAKIIMIINSIIDHKVCITAKNINNTCKKKYQLMVMRKTYGHTFKNITNLWV